MCALHGAATLAATLLRSFDAGAAGPSRALVDEALAVAEGLVMRQFDASLCAANRVAVLVTCVRAGWALVGALVAASGDASWLDARRRRLVEVWGRAIDAAGDGDALSGGYGVAGGGGALDETHELVCLEAAAASVHALAQSAGAALEGRWAATSRACWPRSSSRRAAACRAQRTAASASALVAAGLLEAYAALPPAAFEGDPRAAGRVFDWAVGFPPGIDPCFFVGHAAAGAGVGDGADAAAPAARAGATARQLASTAASPRSRPTRAPAGPDGPDIGSGAAGSVPLPRRGQRSRSRAAAAAAHVPALVAAAGLSGGALLDQLALLGDAALGDSCRDAVAAALDALATTALDLDARQRPEAPAARAVARALCLKALDGGLGRATQ
ncbi:acetylcholine-gated cation-selective channel [Aureococcus anophagefferens]|nr:acetylcholine-gated cation-selective channel [Aureococcus anophagefferens]